MAVSEEKIQLFEHMPVNKAVIKQIVPAIISQLITLLYNWADTYFISCMNIPEIVAGATAVLPVFLSLSAIGNLPGVGGGTKFANYLGEKNTESARKVSAVAFWMGMILAFVFCALSPLFSEPVLRLIGADDASIAPAMTYFFWVITIGGGPTILNLVLSNLIRAEGHAKIASAGLAAGGILNIILDPFFVLNRFLGLGIAGAGIATAISNVFTLVIFLVVIFRNSGTFILTLSVSLIKNTGKYVAEIIKVGFSASIQYLLTVVAVAAQTFFVSKYGNEPLAAIGIVKKLDYLPLYFTIGLSQGIQPLLAYTHTAGLLKRRNSIFKLGCKISLGFSLLCLVCYEAFAPALAEFFIKDAATISYIIPFLRIMVVAMPFMSICYPSITLFQAVGLTREALVCSIIRKGVVDIPLLIIMDSLIPLYGCMMVQPIVDFSSMIVAFILMIRHVRMAGDL